MAQPDCKRGINLAFGRVVVKMRKERGLSQEAFAWDIGSDKKYMSDVELGKRSVSLGFAAKVAKGFGISIYDLFVLIEKELESNECIPKL